MVLKAAAKPAPQFENPDEESDVAVAETAAPAAEKPAANVPATRTATGGAVAAPRPNMADCDVIGALKDALPPVEYGEGVRLVGSNGQLMDDDKKLLGDSITLVLLSWNHRYVISPGENGAEAKEHARYSLDGVTTSKGENVDEYLANLRDKMGYSKASKKLYVDLFGILEAAGKPSDHVGNTVSVSLSPDSVKAFTGMRRDVVVKKMLGQIDVDASAGVRLTISTEIKSANGNTWTRLQPKLA